MFHRSLLIMMLLATVTIFAGSAAAVLQGDFCVHISNNHTGGDTIVIGDTNTLEIWIESDARLEAMSPSLELTFTKGVEWIWNDTMPELTFHNRAVGSYPDGSCWTWSGTLFGYRFHDNGVDSLSFGGIALPGDGMLSGGSELAYSLRFLVPSYVAEADTGLCIDPIFFPNAATWTFTDELHGYPPDFCGQVVLSEVNPVADSICFPMVRMWQCGDADGNDTVDIADAAHLVDYLCSNGAPPDPFAAGDADGCNNVNLADAVYLVQSFSGGGPSLCPESTICMLPTEKNFVTLGCPPQFITPQADTVIDIPVYLDSELEHAGFVLGFQHNSNELEIDSVSIEGSVIWPELDSLFIVEIDTAANQVLIGWTDLTAEHPIPISTDTLLFTLKATLPASATPQSIDFEMVVVGNAGELLFAPATGGWLIPDYYDCGTEDIVILPEYILGDADGNYIINISDAVFLIAYIFGGGPAPNPVIAGDADCNAIVNISDVVFLISYIFGGGPAPGDTCP